MRELILIISVFNSLIGFSQCIDSTVYINFNNSKIECLKRYCLSAYDDYGDPIDSSYILKDCKIKKENNQTINIAPHPEYVFSSQYDEYGRSSIIDKRVVSTIRIVKNIGLVDKESLIQTLLSPIFIEDINREKYPVNFKIIISTKSEYIEIPQTNFSWREILSYELNKLEQGDYVIMSNINFKLSLHSYNRSWFLDNMYWEIQ